MTVGIVGLGLIGGSMAKAYKREEKIRVLAFDKDKITTDFAILSGVVDKELTKDSIKECDLIFICVYPEAAIDFLKENSQYIPSHTVVIDCLGVKKEICETGFSCAQKYGYTFVGGHPMAGTHNSGFKYSKATLFDNAPMVIVPPKFDDMAFLDNIKKMLSPARFGFISVTTAEEHDKMIAFTSQMPHIVSNSFIKSPTARNHKGFSAGSYKDLTRVAWLNPGMWAELFMANKENILNELDIFIENTVKYKEAIQNDDIDTLIKLLDEGRNIKAEVDKR